MISMNVLAKTSNELTQSTQLIKQLRFIFRKYPKQLFKLSSLSDKPRQLLKLLLKYSNLCSHNNLRRLNHRVRRQ